MTKKETLLIFLGGTIGLAIVNALTKKQREDDEKACKEAVEKSTEDLMKSIHQDMFKPDVFKL